MIEIKNVCRTFSTGGNSVEALKNVTLTVQDGDIYGIIGMSGAGKSTLIRCINMLERPDEGSVLLDGCDLSTLSEKELRRVRREITMVFQGFHLLMQKNCLKNVCFPLELSGVKKAEAEKRAMELLNMVGLQDKAYAYPSQLSGGQQQRVAIARALASKPKVLLCDEATRALDPTTTQSILQLIREINQTLGITVIVITHQMSVVESICNHVAILNEGRVVEEGKVSEIFSNPKSETAKKLVFPEKAEEMLATANQVENLVRVVFDGAETTCTPLIAHLALQEGIPANIFYASTKSIGGKVYGSMILSFASSEEAERAIAFLKKTENVIPTEVKTDAQ